MSGYYCGIDFGNTFIKASTSNSGKNSDIYFTNGKSLLPNVISRRVLNNGDSNYSVGDSALREYHNFRRKGVDILYNVKKRLESEDTDIVFSDGVTVKAEELANVLFEKIAERVLFQNAKRFPEFAAVTVPVSYSEVQKRRIRRAAENAGFKVNAMLPEPVAAVFSTQPFKDFMNDGKRRLCFIIDFGGGTIDAALIRMSKSSDSGLFEIEVSGTGGIKFGGSDITNLMVEQIVKPRLNGRVVREFDLFNETEEAKKQILGDDDDSVDLSFEDEDGNWIDDITLTASDFDSVILESGIEERIAEMITDVFQSTDYDIEDVTDVQFVGGGSYINRFVKLVEGLFGIEIGRSPVSDDTPIKRVAAGASVFSEIISSRSDIVIRERLNYSVLSGDRKYNAYLVKGEYIGAASPVRPLFFSADESGRTVMKFYQVMCDTTEPEYRKLRDKTAGEIPPDGIYIGQIDITEQPWRDEAQGFDISLQRDGTFRCGIYGKNGLLGSVNLDMEG